MLKTNCSLIGCVSSFFRLPAVIGVIGVIGVITAITPITASIIPAKARISAKTSNPANASIPANAKLLTDSTYSHGIVVSAYPDASKIGIAILKKGGNAIDAAVAVEFALAVVYPNAGNIGGGGFMVLRTADGKANSLDFREEAPAASRHDMYLDASGKVIKDASTLGFLAAGVPGSVDGMVEAHKRYGKLAWKELVQPAIDLATAGFILTAKEATVLNENAAILRQINGPKCILIKDSIKWKAGDRLKLPSIAKTLSSIRDYGRAGFYEGWVAKSIALDIKKGGGILTASDLYTYHSIWRKPITGNYRGYKIISMPPPSSGGVALIQLLKSVEPYTLSTFKANSAKTIHLYTEAEGRIYADRAYFMGDPDFVEMPVSIMISAEYNRMRMKNFDSLNATPSSKIKAGEIEGYTNLEKHIIKEKMQTTHFSVADKDGNAVSVTTTLNDNFGSKVILSETGFVLNNEMDDFSIKTGYPNAYGLIGGEANAIQPHKRMLSSMTPTIVEKEGKLFMVLGSPGGSTIITTVFQTIINVIDFKMPVQKAVSQPRVHSQWLPDSILVEQNALSPEVRLSLKQMGHLLQNTSEIGRMDAIEVHGGSSNPGSSIASSSNAGSSNDSSSNADSTNPSSSKPGFSYAGGADPRGDDTTCGY